MYIVVFFVSVALFLPVSVTQLETTVSQCICGPLTLFLTCRGLMFRRCETKGLRPLDPGARDVLCWQVKKNQRIENREKKIVGLVFATVCGIGLCNC